MDGFDKLERTSLPPKGKFFSSLTNEDISDTDYRRAQNVWNTFGRYAEQTTNSIPCGTTHHRDWRGMRV
ncbi:Hypothetical predicted protein [Paramuricea clavata]|uniref:Uncharacterized protein n=1 Tax=Paramuricea clavata TaxID=317549 RepID=A0A7D9D907_PARCT|nr:Hypothetical predicted protein [Paramuricea clavata]